MSAQAQSLAVAQLPQAEPFEVAEIKLIRGRLLAVQVILDTIRFSSLPGLEGERHPGCVGMSAGGAQTLPGQFEVFVGQCLVGLCFEEVVVGKLFLPGDLGLLASHNEQADREKHDSGDEQHGDAGDDGAMAPPPACQPGGQRLAASRDRFVVQPVLDVIGQLAGRAVAVFRSTGHRLEANRLEGARHIAAPPRWNWRRPFAQPSEQFRHISPLVGRVSREQVIEDRSQSVHVCHCSHQARIARRLFRRHVRRRSQHLPRLGKVGFLERQRHSRKFLFDRAVLRQSPVEQ